MDLSHAPLPPRLRPAAALRWLDITKYFGPDTGGIRTYLLAKAAWVASDPSLAQVLVIPGDHDSVADTGGSRWYRIHGPRIPGQRSYRFLFDGARLARVLSHERPDLVEIGSPFVVPWLTRRALGGRAVPLAWFYHTHLPRIVNPRGERGTLWRRGAERMAWRYVRAVARRCRGTLAASEAVAHELEAHRVPRVFRVSLGVDLDGFHPGRRARAAATRERYGLPFTPLVVYAGRVTAEKELDVALEAWPAIARATDATLVVIGHGPLEQRFKARFAGPGIRWLPFETDRDRLADLLAAADLYLAPGPAESFGLAALEALASGTPVLSVECGGVAELVRRSGAGACYPVGNRAALADACIGLLEGGAEGLRAPARAYAVAHHAWPVVLGTLLEVYRSMVGTAGQ
ncbi:MAG: glycosyltransferase [Gemmatimonadales bacterium]